MEEMVINMALAIVMHFVKNPQTDARIIALLNKLHTVLGEVPGVGQ